MGKMIGIMPCPFCGESENLGIIETERKIFKEKRSPLMSVVVCYCCGAIGPCSNDAIVNRTEMETEHIIKRKKAANLAWDARSQIEKKAIEVANRIMATALEVGCNISINNHNECNEHGEKNGIENDLKKSTETITNILTEELKRNQIQAYELGVYRGGMNTLDEKLEATSISIEKVVSYALSNTKEQAYKLGARQSHQALSTILKTKISVSALRLFVSIMVNTLCEGKVSCNFNREELEQVSGITTDSTIYKALDELESRKMIVRTKKADWCGRWNIAIQIADG